MMDAPGATCLLDTYPYKLTLLSSEGVKLVQGGAPAAKNQRRLSSISIDNMKPPSHLRGVHIHPLSEDVESIYERPAPTERILHKENVHSLGGGRRSKPGLGRDGRTGAGRTSSVASPSSSTRGAAETSDPLLSDASYAQRLSDFSPVSLLSLRDFLLAQEVLRTSQLQYSLEHSASARRLLTRARYVLLDASLLSAAAGSFEAVVEMCAGCAARHQVVALSLCGWGWWNETDGTKEAPGAAGNDEPSQQEDRGLTDTGTPRTVLYSTPTSPVKFPEFAHSALFRASAPDPTAAHWPETAYPDPPQAAFLQRTRTVLRALLPYVDVLFCTDRACGPLWMALTDEPEGGGADEGTGGTENPDEARERREGSYVAERVRDRLRGGGPSVWRVDGSEVDAGAAGREGTGGACRGGSHAARLAALVSMWRKVSGRRARACVVLPTAAAKPAHAAAHGDMGDTPAQSFEAGATSPSSVTAFRSSAANTTSSTSTSTSGSGRIIGADRTVRSQVPEVRRAAAGLVRDITLSISGLVIDTPHPVLAAGSPAEARAGPAARQQEARRRAALDGSSVGSEKSGASHNTFSTRDSVGRAGSLAMVQEKARLRLDQSPVRAFDPAASVPVPGLGTGSMGASAWGSTPFHNSTTTTATASGAGAAGDQVLVGLLGQVIAVPHWPAFVNPTHPITAPAERPPEPRGRGKRVRLYKGHLRLCKDDGLPRSPSVDSVLAGRSLSPSSPILQSQPGLPPLGSPQEALAGLDAFIGGYLATLARLEAQLDAHHAALPDTAQAAAAQYIVDTRALVSAAERAAYRSRFGCEMDGSPAVLVNRREMLDAYSQLGRDLVSGRKKPPKGPVLPVGLGLGGGLPAEAYRAEVPQRPPEIGSVAGGRRAVVECVRAGCFARTAAWDDGAECDYYESASS